MRSSLRLDDAVQALQYAARYDSMRLETYREKENLGQRIRVMRKRSALALRFDDVGYFNRVYAPDETALEHLPEIEEFYRGSPFGCELVGPPGSHGIRIGRPGWRPGNCYAWMHAPDLKPAPPAHPAEFTIREPELSQRQQFLLAYLRGFEAQEDRIPAALLNMRHLFDRPELVFLMAWHRGQPAGVGMIMRCDSAALLCAGAALPQYRERGCHAALLAARIRWASETGYRQLYSWVLLGGQSQANLERAGLSVAGTTAAWRFSPHELA